MIDVNIRRPVENIRVTTRVYAPVVEMIVRGISAIDEKDLLGLLLAVFA